MSTIQLECLFCGGTGKTRTVKTSSQDVRCLHCRGTGMGGWDRQLSSTLPYQCAFVGGLVIPMLILLGQIVRAEWKQSVILLVIGFPALLGYYAVYGKVLSRRRYWFIPTLIVVTAVWLVMNSSRLDMDLMLLASLPAMLFAIRAFPGNSSTGKRGAILVWGILGCLFLVLLMTAWDGAFLVFCVACAGYSLMWILKLSLGFVSAPRRHWAFTEGKRSDSA